MPWLKLDIHFKMKPFHAGLIRVHELNMGEIEHYVDPEDKTQDRFYEIWDVIFKLKILGYFGCSELPTHTQNWYEL